MTQEQYDNWKDFAIRMAKTVYPNATEKRREKIYKEVADYFYWREFQDDWHDIVDWDGNGDDYHLASAVDEFFDKYSHWNRRLDEFGGKLFNQITCCIRAGFDMAVKQSGGVLGFDIGDVRRMYAGTVPAWVSPDNFENKPDDTPIWL